MSSLSGFGDFAPDIIEPTLCFTVNKIKIDQNYPLDQLPIEEIVKKDQVLLEFSEEDFSESKRAFRRPVISGRNTHMSEDKKQVLADATGYPVVRFFAPDDEKTKTLELSIEPLFKLTSDRMEASIILKPLIFNYSKISSEDLYQLLTDSGIVTGVEYKQLNFTKEEIRSGSSSLNTIVLAHGKRPIGGSDAYLKYEIEIGPIAGKLFKDGTIDFRERKIMVPVSAGDVIATKVPPTYGQVGETVLGERIAARQGQDMEITTLDSAAYDPDTRKIIATSNGVLSVIRGTTFKVCSKQEIPGDIDYSIGNVESRDSVVIRGSVLPGFLVTTDGDLEIHGSVNSTRISSKSNIVIKGGIIGTNSRVSAAGDVDILFIEQGRIHCEGNCVIRKQCYYSRVFSGGDIRCQELSTVAGGELIAEGAISLGNAGSPGANPALVAAGTVAERLYKAREIEKQLRNHQDSIIERLKGYTGVARKKKLRVLKNGIEELKMLQLRINLIPGTGLYSRPPSESDETVSEQPVQDETENTDALDIATVTIDVFGTIYAGTIIRIGNRTLTVEDDMIARRFILDETKSHILVTPLR